MTRGQTRNNKKHKDKARLSQTPDRDIDNNDMESGYSQEPADIAALDMARREDDDTAPRNQRTE